MVNIGVRSPGSSLHSSPDPAPDQDQGRCGIRSSTGFSRQVAALSRWGGAGAWLAHIVRLAAVRHGCPRRNHATARIGSAASAWARSSRMSSTSSSPTDSRMSPSLKCHARRVPRRCRSNESCSPDAESGIPHHPARPPVRSSAAGSSCIRPASMPPSSSKAIMRAEARPSVGMASACCLKAFQARDSVLSTRRG
jgi:hypothetical protein